MIPLVLTKYKKKKKIPQVTRTKAKWRCTLKEGVMSLNGKDRIFQKATGEFDWV